MDIEKISKYLLTTVLKLLKGVPDLWRADVSRIIKELKEMVELESHAGERQRSVIRAHREFLVDEAVERLAYETYTRKGLRFWANQQELVCGYFSLFLVGGLYGIDVGLLLLVCVMSQDMNGAAAVGKLLIAFAVTASSTILAAMIGKRIYTHVALRKQFRLDILERIRDGGSGMDASFTQAMEKSYKRLHEYEETRRVWKYRILVLSCLLTASLLVLVAAMAFNCWCGCPMGSFSRFDSRASACAETVGGGRNGQSDSSENGSGKSSGQDGRRRTGKSRATRRPPSCHENP